MKAAAATIMALLVICSMGCRVIVIGSTGDATAILNAPKDYEDVLNGNEFTAPLIK